MERPDRQLGIGGIDQDGKLDLRGGDRTDVDAALGQRLEGLGSDAGMAAHADPDHRDLGDVGRRVEAFIADLRLGARDGLLGALEIRGGNGEGEVRGGAVGGYPRRRRCGMVFDVDPAIVTPPRSSRHHDPDARCLEGGLELAGRFLVGHESRLGEQRFRWEEAKGGVGAEDRPPIREALDVERVDDRLATLRDAQQLGHGAGYQCLAAGAGAVPSEASLAHTTVSNVVAAPGRAAPP